MKNKLIIFSAPSGAGKSTIISKVLAKGVNLEFSISACNRKMREGEIDGKHYYFLSTEEFKEKIKNDAFIEWEEVYKDNYYGTLKSEIERISANGNHTLFDVDVEGGVNIKHQYKERALSIFIKPPSIEELKKRLILRATDTAESIEKRVSKAAKEIEYASKFDKIVINDNLEKAVNETIEIIKNFLEK